MKIDGKEDSTVDYEITVTAPTTTEEFIQFLRSQGFKGNVATNANYPGKIWLGPNPNNA